MSARLEARSWGLRSDSLTGAAIVAAFAAAGLLAGYVIASGQPIPIALVLGTIIGVALLSTLSLVVWIVLIGTLLVSGPVVMFVPGLEKMTWLFSMLGLLLAGGALLHSAVGRNRMPGALPDFILLAAAVAGLGLLSLLYSGGPLSEGVRAAKRYYQYFGLAFALAVVPFAPALVRRWWIFVIALAFVQVPFTIYQRIFLVPILEGRPNVIPIDIVVGTMEGSLWGGGSSSVMALLVVFAIAYLLAAHRDGLLGRTKLGISIFVLAIPLVVGEVTLLVVLLPLAFAAVYHDLIRVSPLRALGALFLAGSVAVAGEWFYLMINAAPGQTLADIVDGVVAYNFGATGYFGGASLNRTSVYTYWFQNHGLDDPVALLFGHGLGSSFGGINEPDPGHMDLRHSGLHIGLTAASSLLWDLGLLGFSLYAVLHLNAARAALTLSRSANQGFDRAFCRALFAMSLMLIPMLFYSGGLISVPSQQVLTTLVLGLIAWRQRDGDQSAIAAPSNKSHPTWAGR